MNKSKAFRYILGLIALGELNFMFWSGAWSSNPNFPYELWVDVWGLQIRVYECFCIFWLLGFFALTCDFWVSCGRWLKKKWSRLNGN